MRENDFGQKLPRDERVIYQRLRSLVLEAEPRLKESISYGVPYFSRHRRLFFIWPVSAPDAPKAKNQKDDGTKVSLGFCYGNLLSNDQGLLLAEGRKQVYIIRFRTVKEVDKIENEILEILQEAVITDEMKFGKMKKINQ